MMPGFAEVCLMLWNTGKNMVIYNQENGAMSMGDFSARSIHSVNMGLVKN